MASTPFKSMHNVVTLDGLESANDKRDDTTALACLLAKIDSKLQHLDKKIENLPTNQKFEQFAEKVEHTIVQRFQNERNTKPNPSHIDFVKNIVPHIQLEQLLKKIQDIFANVFASVDQDRVARLGKNAAIVTFLGSILAHSPTRRRINFLLRRGSILQLVILQVLGLGAMSAGLAADHVQSLPLVGRLLLGSSGEYVPLERARRYGSALSATTFALLPLKLLFELMSLKDARRSLR